MEVTGIVLIVVFSVVLGIVSVAGGDTYDKGLKAKELIKECEYKLPRNQSCKIISIEANNENN